MEAGRVVVERVSGKSRVTTCFSKYPLKFIVPNKGDSISCHFTVAHSCTAVLTTQASTKVYKSLPSKSSNQFVEASVGSNALLVVIPDPVTCFSTARYSQKQVFTMHRDSNLVLVDWVTSGRYQSGEKWDFDRYKSTNNIFLQDNEPLLLDTMLLEKGGVFSIAEQMQEYQVIAMVVLWGPKISHIQKKVQEDVKTMMTDQLQFTSPMKRSSDCCVKRPNFIASSSVFGCSKGNGVIVRIVATTTESVYNFLRCQLSSLEPLLGVSPYH